MAMQKRENELFSASEKKKKNVKLSSIIRNWKFVYFWISHVLWYQHQFSQLYLDYIQEADDIWPENILCAWRIQ